MVDGREQDVYQEVETRSLVFSPDNQHLAYVARTDKGRAVVLDGRVLQPYDAIEPRSLVFSPDSQRLAYLAREGNQWVVVDGQEQQRWDDHEIVHCSLLFSPDGQRLAYVTRKYEGWGAWKLSAVVDGEKQEAYEYVENLAFSLDSQHLTYLAHLDYQWLIVRGQEQQLLHEQWMKSDSSVFSPDHQRLAYVLQEETWSEKQFVVVDGKEQKAYNGIEGIVFSPDSRRLAYVANLGSGRVAVVDGREQRRSEGVRNAREDYYKIESGSFVFSPDSQRFAYIAVWDHPDDAIYWFVVVDGQEQKSYQEAVGDLERASLAFSADSNRFAYVVSRGWWTQHRFVVIDEQEGSHFSRIVGPQRGGCVIFDSSDQLHYIGFDPRPTGAPRRRGFYAVQEELA